MHLVLWAGRGQALETGVILSECRLPLHFARDSLRSRSERSIVLQEVQGISLDGLGTYSDKQTTLHPHPERGPGPAPRGVGDRDNHFDRF